MSANSLLEAPSFRVGSHQFTDIVLWRDCNLHGFKKAQEQGKLGSWFE